jgi:RNA polymerase sigma-70 factor (ECF subfamily)
MSCETPSSPPGPNPGTGPSFDVEGFRSGRRDVLDQVYRRYVHHVERVVRCRFCSARARRARAIASTEVPDLVQEVFARAFTARARTTYDGRRDYRPFLSAIARNLVTDWERRQRPHRELSDEMHCRPPADTERDAERALHDLALARAVDGYLAALPGELRSVFEQRYVLGRIQREAASALGLTRQQLRTRESKLHSGLVSAVRDFDAAR